MTKQKTNHQQGQASKEILSGYSEGQLSGSQLSGSTTAMTQQSQQSQSSGGQLSVVGVFSGRSEAEQAVQQLRQSGFTNEEISIVTKKKNSGQQGQGSQPVDDDITDGALTGGTLGGLGGLILGAGALAVPGVGPILAAGPIAAALSGAVAGGIAGGLIDWGIPEEASQQYQQNVAEGDTLAVVRTTPQKVNQAAQVLRQNGARDVQSHADKRAAR